MNRQLALRRHTEMSQTLRLLLKSSGGFILEECRETLRYRYVISNYVYTSLAVKYKRSFLGYLWTVLSPLIRFLIMGYVFATLGRFDMPHYYAFMFLGAVYFGFVSSSMAGAGNIFLQNEHFIKKIYLPKLVFVLNQLCFEFINFVLIFCSIVILLISMKEVTVSIHWAFVFVSLLITLVALIGFAMTMAVASVYFRDLPHILEICMSSLFFATPIMYPIEITLKNNLFHNIVVWNPLYYFTELFRMPLRSNQIPDIKIIGICLVISISVLMVGFFVLGKFNNRIIFKL